MQSHTGSADASLSPNSRKGAPSTSNSSAAGGALANLEAQMRAGAEPEVNIDDLPLSSRWLHGREGHAEQTLQFPTPMLADLKKYAQRLDQPVSWCLRMAWHIAASQMDEPTAMASIAHSRLLKGRKRPCVVQMPYRTWLHIALEAEQQDRSRSWLLQRAWLLARASFVGSV